MRRSLLRKEGGSMRKQEEPPDRDGGLTPVKGREQERGLRRKSPGLQRSFEKVLVRPRARLSIRGAPCSLALVFPLGLVTGREWFEKHTL